LKDFIFFLKIGSPDGGSYHVDVEAARPLPRAATWAIQLIICPARRGECWCRTMSQVITFMLISCGSGTNPFKKALGEII
jgi:hypothetical protein